MGEDSMMHQQRRRERDYAIMCEDVIRSPCGDVR